MARYGRSSIGPNALRLPSSIVREMVDARIGSDYWYTADVYRRLCEHFPPEGKDFKEGSMFRILLDPHAERAALRLQLQRALAQHIH